jgi:acetyltransferase-like isoleucine patch superfamily enzyme
MNVECTINHYTTFEVGEYVSLSGDRSNKSPIYFYNGIAKWGNNVNINAKINCFKSVFTIGDNVFINMGTEIRSESSITIGSNNFISYDCILFDTNTHSLSHLSRRDEINQGFPNTTKQSEAIKNEIKKAPIVIGNDVWIGTRAIIFKGTVIGDRVIVGAASLLSGLEVPEDKKVVGNPGVIK